MILLGDSILSTEEGENIHATIKKIADNCNVIKEGWNGFNILSPYASRVGGLEVGFIPTKNGINARQIKKRVLEKEIKLLFLIEADDFEIDEIDNTLRMLSKEMNIAVLIVEHRIELLETIADRVVVMDAGEIIAEGNLEDIINNPKVKEAYFEG